MRTESTGTTNTAPDTALSIEDAITRSLAAMRAVAAQAPESTDYLDVWAREIMDQRPLIYVAVVMEGQTLGWVMTPNDVDVLRARGGQASVTTEVVMRSKALHDAAVSIDWAVRELTGEGLSKR